MVARSGSYLDRRCFVAHTQELCFWSLWLATCNCITLIPTLTWKIGPSCVSLCYIGLLQGNLVAPSEGSRMGGSVESPSLDAHQKCRILWPHTKADSVQQSYWPLFGGSCWAGSHGMSVTLSRNTILSQTTQHLLVHSMRKGEVLLSD